MTPAFRFSFEAHWRNTPLAYWVHIPVAGKPDTWQPPAPPCIPHRGYVILHVAFEQFDLVFSSPAQLDHFITVLSTKPLPTSSQLSALRNAPVGPNGHWLSRLPSTLKAPPKRTKLVQRMQEVRALAVSGNKQDEFNWTGHSIVNA